jgi:dihydrofolate reductase
MRKIIVTEFMTLDGVVQGPSSPDEDRSDGFTRGGWHPPYFDDVAREWVVANIQGASAYLFGRRTYEIFAAHWPAASPEEQILAEPFNTKPKYVVSTTLAEPLDWRHSTLVAAEDLAELKRQDGGALLLLGSTELVGTLLDANLVDELRLMIDPVVVGAGKRLFGDQRATFTLADSRATTTGAILATYVPA